MRKIFRILTVLSIGLFFSKGAQAAVPAATFLSVSGKVTVEDSMGHIREARNDSKTVEGEKVTVEKDAKATLAMFDGSILEVSHHTQFVIDSLKQPSPLEKKIRFNLGFGTVLAVVKKLMTSSSIFEVEAGGVVCGVRGTQFSVAYDPDQSKVDLKVLEGTVYTKAGGKTLTVPAGQEREFLNGQPISRLDEKDSSFLAQNKADILDPTLPEAVSPALDDMTMQFTQNLSVNGSSILKAPVLGSTLNSTVNLINNTGPVRIFIPGLLPKIGL